MAEVDGYMFLIVETRQNLGGLLGNLWKTQQCSLQFVDELTIWAFFRPEDIFGSLEVNGEGVIEGNGNYQPSGMSLSLALILCGNVQSDISRL